MQALSRIVEHVRSLCQDLHHTVRECMCAQVVVPLARSLGPDKAATNVLEDILELIQVLLFPLHKHNRMFHILRFSNACPWSRLLRESIHVYV